MPRFELIDVPYASQWDADAHLARGDCGIVCASMLARWRGIKTSSDAMLDKADLPIGKHSYTFNEIIAAAKSVGLKLRYVHPAGLLQIQQELDAGRPVISLIRYGELTGNQDDFDGAHFVVVVGCDRSVYINDPDWWGERRAEGKAREVRTYEFASAIGDALLSTGNMGVQSLFLA